MTNKERTIRNANIIIDRHAGKSMNELAKENGLTVSGIHSICKRYGVDGVMSAKRGIPKEYRNQYTTGLFDQEGNAISIINERTPGFEYVGNFTGCDGYVDLKCKKCGTILHRSMITVRHSNVSCDICKAAESEKKRKEREEKKQIEKRRKEADREERKRLKRANRKAEQLSMKECLCCGELFASFNKRTAYCSDECRNKIMNARTKDKRIKLMRHVAKDNNITLEKLYDRDNGVCALCGNKCDWNDYHVRNNGAFIAMDMYPSIDHIIPLSKGGTHSWENVQLACRGCNSRKGANITPSLSA